ncbi:MAG: rhodanese-like domain-containing protein [Xanthomonadales bacterium]|nr:rhodanese-like domain-containing protein [Xanthomonadales bacterium]
MEQLIEFSGNHPLLTGGFVAVLLFLVWSEIQRRTRGFTELAPAEAVPLINRENTVVVDVSASADYHRGHIVNAKNIKPSRLAKPDAELTKLLDRPLLVVCKNGQASPAAAGALVKLGAKNVAVLKGGMLQWNADNYPVTRS